MRCVSCLAPVDEGHTLCANCRASDESIAEYLSDARYVVAGKAATREEYRSHQATMLALYGNAYSCVSSLPGGPVFRSLEPADVQERIDPGIRAHLDIARSHSLTLEEARERGKMA